MKCFQCKYRTSIPGDAHSRCQHPKLSSADPLEEVIAVFASVGRINPVVSEAAVELGIKANPRGVKKGWFNWPWNFDPAWLENCNGFEKQSKC